MKQGLGSIRAEINHNSQAIAGTRTMNPYGDVMTGYNYGAMDSGYGFTGEQIDPNELVYLRARYYDPTVGVFASLDPFEGVHNRPMSVNGYSWVEGNVANWVDPTGKICRSGERDTKLIHTRALTFYRRPSFQCMPIDNFDDEMQGFGPTNRSYRLHVLNDTAYSQADYLHAGLDFKAPHGTPVIAMDWGVVFNATPGGCPWLKNGQGECILIRHGGYVVMYGHLDSIDTSMRNQIGKIVAPGDTLGFTGAGEEHLHLEVRKIPEQLIINAQDEVLNLLGVYDSCTQRQAMSDYFNNQYSFTTPENFRVDNRYDYHNPLLFFRMDLKSQVRNLIHTKIIDKGGVPDYYDRFAYDTDRNGYPDRIVVMGDSPTAFHAESCADVDSCMNAYGKVDNFWADSVFQALNS